MPAFSFEVDDRQIGVITFDLPGEKVNKLSISLLGEVEELIERIEKQHELRGLVLISGKEDTFIAGADIDDFVKLTSVAAATTLSQRGQMVLNKFAALRVPIVAAIHGACLGGGVEVALACHYRVASDAPKTVLALPEVQLGLLPGGGGTQRLPRLINLATALDMILTGKNIYPKKAKQLGLVDEVVPYAVLLDVAKQAALRLASNKQIRSSKKRSGGLKEWLLAGNPLGRAILFWQARKMLLAKTRGLYPAPLCALEAVKLAASGAPLEMGLAFEAKHFGELALTDVSRQLVNLFFAITALKKETGVADKNVQPHEVRKLGILGAGFMGAGIAMVAADKGITVRLRDKDDESLGRGVKACYDYFQQAAKRGRYSRSEAERRFTHISSTTDYSGFHTADLTIEAVFEDLTLKQQVLKDWETVAREDAIFASNTSSIPIKEIAHAARRQESVLGMHFFSPVAKMPLLEVIATKQTAKSAIATAVELGKTLGKTTIVVSDGVGFYTTRILAPYMNEAAMILTEGAAIEEIDAALLDFGFPVGPIALMDEVGIDVGAKVAKVMYAAFGERMHPVEAMQKIINDGRMGRKNKRGFYTYTGKQKHVDITVYDLLPQGRTRVPITREAISERLSLAMVNEAALCLQEGILHCPRDGDVGAIMGLGFPPFRGGPFRYIDSIGAAALVNRLETLATRLGTRFQPAAILVDAANKGTKFYST
ncbi:MAG: fatty acid oxidation complex subunit alpha FadJ [Acidobacteriota bacterium]